MQLINKANSIIGGSKSLANNINQKHIICVNQYILNPKHCLQCNEAIVYENRRNDFCSRSCSASYSNTGKIVSIATKQKLSAFAKLNPSGAVAKSIQGIPINHYLAPRIITTCPTCNNLFDYQTSQPKIYCSSKCYLTSGKAGGYRINSTKVHRTISITIIKWTQVLN